MSSTGDDHCVPLNNGQHCPIAPITPRPVNWPIESSMNSSGMPQMNRVMKYGSKKTPESKRNEHNLSQSI
jgi:hypothetical protein